jgi:hypothetical protein
MAGLSGEFSACEATVFARALVIKSTYAGSRLSTMFLSKMVRPALRSMGLPAARGEDCGYQPPHHRTGRRRSNCFIKPLSISGSLIPGMNKMKPGLIACPANLAISIGSITGVKSLEEVEAL